MPSGFPAASTALTSNVWLPAETGPGYVFGFVHGANAAPSSEHSKLPLSFEENSNVGEVSFDGSEGFASIVVSGASVSIVHV